MRRIAVVIVAFIAVLAAAAAVAIARGGVVDSIVARVAKPYGYNVAFAQSHIGLSRTDLSGVRVTNDAGEPVFSASKIEAGYSLWALVRGTRQFGLEYVDVVDPRVTLIHHRDGTFNVKPIHLASGGNKKPAPLDVRVNVSGGNVDLIDQYSAAPKVRREQIVGIAMHGAISPTARTGYTARMALQLNGRRYPITGTGTFDAPEGYTSQVWTAATVPIAQLVDFGLPTHAVRVAGGELRDVVIRTFGLRDRDGSMQSHLGGHASLASVDIVASGLREPLRNAHGNLYLSDGAIALPRVDATLGSVPIAAAGGVYDFASPTIRMGVQASAALEQLKTLSPAMASHPVRGRIALQALALGPVSKPLVFASFASPSIAYGTMTVSGVHGSIAMQGTEVDILDAALRYGPVNLGARGTVTLEKQPGVTIVASVAGPADELPYASQIVPHMPLRGVAIVSGAGRALDFNGVIDGATASQQLSGIANIKANGTGTAGPISIDGPGGSSLFAMVALDRPAGSSDVLVDANRFAIRPGHPVSLPGLSIRALPNVDGIIAAHAVAFQHGRGLDYLGGDVAVTSAHYNGIGVDRMLAIGQMARKNVNVVADVRSSAATFRRAGMPLEAGEAEAIADVSGQLPAPRAGVSAMLVGGKIAKAPVSGNVVLAYDGGNSIAIVRSTVSIGGGLATANGTVRDIRSKSPSFDIAAQMREADLAVLTKTFGVHLPYAEGRIEADAHVFGSGKTPNVAGDVSIPEASINALPFQAQTEFSGNASHIVTHGGRIVVGSTTLKFSADVGSASKNLSIASRAVNLADFNDYFPAAETLGGTGSLAAEVNASNGGLSSRGSVALTNVRYRRFALGSTNARWNTNGREIAANGFVAGRGGTVHLSGTALMPSGITPTAIENETVLNATASVRNFDLATWLPAAGVNAPILGHLDADATARGRLRTVAVAANATLTGGLIGQIPVQRFTISATAQNGRARLLAANFEIPDLSATASGSFSLSPKGPLDFTMHATSPDIGALAKTVTKKPSPFGGSVATTLHATGDPTALKLDDVVDVQRFTRGNFMIPHVHTEIAYQPGLLEVRNGLVAFQKGSATFSAHVPISVGTLAFSEGAAPSVPISGDILADGIDLGQFASLMPKGTKLGGVLVGEVKVSGTDLEPLLNGALSLSQAAFSSSSLEQTPLTDGAAVLALDRNTMTLSALHFTVGKKGSIDGHGTIVVPNLRDPMDAYSLNLVTALKQANFNVPKYFDGQLDGTIGVTKSASTQPLVAGNLTVSHTRIPAAGMLALALAKPSGKGPSLPVGFNMNVGIGPDVRLEGDGVNVGAAGQIAFTGTLAKPVINGTIDSTGGSVNVYRDFTIDRGTVTWNGTTIIPDLDVTATTFLPQPPTNVRMHVTGPATHMDLALTSNPPYSKGQIVALMIGGPGLAGLNGLQTAQGPQQPGLFEGVGQGVVNGLFAKAITEPLTTNLGTALGLQNVQFNYDVVGQGGFSALVSRRLGPNMSLEFSQTYGFPSRTVVGLRDQLTANTSAGFSIFSTYGLQGLGYYNPYLLAQPGSNISLQAEQPAAGEQGFGLHYTRHFGR